MREDCAASLTSLCELHRATRLAPWRRHLFNRIVNDLGAHLITMELMLVARRDDALAHAPLLDEGPPSLSTASRSMRRALSTLLVQNIG